MAENPYAQYRNMLPSGAKVADKPAETQTDDASQTVDEYGNVIEASASDIAARAARPSRGPPPPVSSKELPAAPGGPAPGAVDRIIEAGREGAAGAPDASGWVPGGLEVGRNIVNPALKVAGAVFRGGQQFVQEAVPDVHLPALPPGWKISLGDRSISGEFTPGSLGREVAAMPEAFPTGEGRGTVGVPKPAAAPQSYAEARAGAQRGYYDTRWSPDRTPPVTLNELTGAINRADVPANRLAPKPVTPPPGDASTQQPPAAAGTPDLAPVPAGHVRLYHGGADPTSGGERWVTPNYEYARDYRPGQPVSYVDVPRDHPAVQAATDTAAVEGTDMAAPIHSFNAPEDIAQKLQPVRRADQPPPGAAGAQITPAAELGMTPAEEAAYRSTAEGNKLLEAQEPGVRDDKVHLTGERINEAEASQDVEVARQLNSLREQTPALDKEMTANENHNNNIRTNAIQNALPRKEQIEKAQAAREKAMMEAEPQVFANATDADVRPIARHIEDELSDPKNRQNTQLGQHVRPLIDRLVNEDGTPKITDPKELWSFRQDVQHLTSKDAQSTDRNLKRISGILGKVIETIDDQIEAAAPGYKAKLRDDYRTRSREIDAMEALNGERLNLFDSQNKPNYNAVQRLMKRIVDARQSNDAYNPFTHVSQETLDQLWAIRDSMRRTAAVDRLGKPRGSPSSQNIGDALRMGAKAAATVAAPAVGAVIGNYILPGIGGQTGGIMAGAALNHLMSQRGLTQRLAQGRGMLNIPNRLGPQAPPP